MRARVRECAVVFLRYRVNLTLTLLCVMFRERRGNQVLLDSGCMGCHPVLCSSATVGVVKVLVNMPWRPDRVGGEGAAPTRL